MKSTSLKTITIIATLLASVLAFNSTLQAEADFAYKKSEITDSITMLHGAGGNIAVLKGGEGLLVVDNGFDKNSGALTAALDELGEAPSFVLNTHWHGDHTGANEALGSSVIVAHQNVRERLAKGRAAPREVKSAATAALPDITYESGTTIHFAGQTVTAVHYPSGHTDGDTVVFFEPAHVVHMGDLMFAGSFPYIDPSSGGSVAGYTQAVAAILKRIDDTTIVIPGHGAVANKADVQRFHDMIVATSATVGSMKEAGKTLEQAQAEGLSDNWQGWGDFFIDEARWISILWAG